MVYSGYKPTGKEDHTILYCTNCKWYSDYGPLQRPIPVPYHCNGYCGGMANVYFIRYGPGEKEEAYKIMRGKLGQ